MGKIAVMVDAGYLLTAAGEAVSGRSLKRHMIKLAADEAVLALFEAASMSEPADDLLRIYWYDAAISPDRLTDEQNQIGLKRSCKLRLGTLNTYGGQKGVDTLMVMDILALSRNKAVSSLLIVSGDDDIRPAIDDAQAYGVRVHLLGVKPLPGDGNQSERLRRECDSFHEWTAADVATFISLVDPNEVHHELQPNLSAGAIADPLADAVEFAMGTASEQDLREVLQFANGDSGAIPATIDRRLLGRYGRNLGRVVGDDEKKMMRRRFIERVQASMLQQAPGNGRS